MLQIQIILVDRNLKLLNKVIEEQSKCLFCKIYQGKHNGSVLLTNERYTEQLEQTQILPMAKCTAEQQKSP